MNIEHPSSVYCYNTLCTAFIRKEEAHITSYWHMLPGNILQTPFSSKDNLLSKDLSLIKEGYPYKDVGFIPISHSSDKVFLGIHLRSISEFAMSILDIDCSPSIPFLEHICHKCCSHLHKILPVLSCIAFYRTHQLTLHICNQGLLVVFVKEKLQLDISFY